MLGGACGLACAGAATAQPRGATLPAYQAVLAGAEPTAGLGATLPVRILDARDLTPALDARISNVRLTSPFGVVTPLPPPPDGAATPGVRVFRGDLPAPGAWALEFTVAQPGRSASAVTVAFSVDAPAVPPFAGNPMGASIAAADPSFAPTAPAIAPPGPGGADAIPAAPVQATRGQGYSPATAPFCAACAAEAPH